MEPRNYNSNNRLVNSNTRQTNKPVGTNNSKTNSNNNKVTSKKEEYYRLKNGELISKKEYKRRKRKIVLKKLNNKVFRGPKGLRNRLIALGLAALTAGTVAAAAVENYNDKDERLIATVQDIDDDNYDGTIPAKVDWTDRKKAKSIELTDGKYYELTDDSIVLVQEDKIKPGNKNNDVIIYSEDGILEGKIKGKYLEKAKYQLTDDATKEYNRIYRVIPEVGANLKSSPKLIDTNENRVMVVTCGEYVLATEPQITNENEYPWVPVIYINENGINKGYIREDLLERMDEKEDKENIKGEGKDTIEKTIMEVDTDHDGGIDLKCRSSAEIREDNILEHIQSGKFVYMTGKKQINEARNWVEIEYTNENNETINGWVDSSYLKEVIEKQMRVNTDSDGGVSLKLRKEASTNSDTLLKIENGYLLNITQDNWESKIEANGYDWIKVNINGTVGYVASNYLEEVKPMIPQKAYTPNITSSELQKIIKSIKLNDLGKVTGIDSFGITADEIENLYTTGIKEENTYSKCIDQNINISNINGDINFMYFRIGATGYGKNFSIIDNTHYVEQVKKCEELGIPYGFYYYSTSVDEAEANKEFECIEKALDSLGELKYNLLPFAVDVELADPQKDRQYGKDTTEAKAYLTNCLQDNLGVDVMLYTSGSCTLSTTEEANVLDLEEYNRLTGVKNVWMPMPKQKNGDIDSSYKEYLNKFPKSMNLVMKQEVLDMETSGAQIDLNTISKGDLIEMLENILRKIEKEENKKEETKIESTDIRLQ